MLKRAEAFERIYEAVSLSPNKKCKQIPNEKSIRIVVYRFGGINVFQRIRDLREGLPV